MVVILKVCPARKKFMSTSCEVAPMWMPQNTCDDKSTMDQVMAWWRPVTTNYLSHVHWPRSKSPYGVNDIKTTAPIVHLANRIYVFHAYLLFFDFRNCDNVKCICTRQRIITFFFKYVIRSVSQCTPSPTQVLSVTKFGHDDVIKWKHFPRKWPFVRGIHRSLVNSPHKGQWRGALMFSLICVWINGWVNNREAGDLRRYRAPLWRSNATPGQCLLTFD